MNHLLAGGVHSTFPAGTNDEAYTLSPAEREGIFAIVIDEVHGKMPIYTDTGCITTADAIHLSKRTEKLDTDTLSIVTPSFTFAPRKELYDHYVAVTKEMHTPIIPYNIPARTSNKFLPEMV